MKLKYRVLTKGTADGAVPLNWVFLEKKDIAAAALTDFEAVKRLKKGRRNEQAGIAAQRQR